MADFFEKMNFFGKEFECNIVARVNFDGVEIEKVDYCPQTCEEGKTYPDGHFKWRPVPEAVLNLVHDDEWERIEAIAWVIANEDGEELFG